MDEQVFGRELIKLAQMMNKNITEDFIRHAYEKLEFIPNEAWPTICDRALGEWDAWPRNFIKVAKGMWAGWQRTRKAEEDYQDCHFCQNTACLDYEYWHKEWEKWIEASCFCGHCNNYFRHTNALINTDRDGNRYRHPRYTIQEIANNGWKWIEPPASCTKEEAVAAMKLMLERLDEKARQMRLAREEELRLFLAHRISRKESLLGEERRGKELEIGVEDLGRIEEEKKLTMFEVPEDDDGPPF